MDALDIQVIIGSTRQGRYGDKPARWIHGELAAREGIRAELVDLRDYPMPFFDEPSSPARMKRVYTHEVVKRWSAKIDAADAYVFTVAEYNHGYSAVLKNSLDVIFPEWSRKAVAFVGYGGVGGARAIEQLRQVAVELHLAPIQAAVHLPSEVFLATRNEPAPVRPELFAPVKERAGMMIDQLVWWASALKAARMKG